MGQSKSQSRRDFLKLGALSAASLSSTFLSRESGAQTDLDPSIVVQSGWPCLQVFTDEMSAQFKILCESSEELSISAISLDGQTLSASRCSRKQNPYNQLEVIEHIVVNGLKIGKEYRLVISNQASGRRDERLFRAFDRSGTRGRFAFVSCMSDGYPKKQGKMWEALAKSQPEVIFLLGDQCYANHDSDGSPASVWRRYAESWRALDFYKWKNLIPSFATWDDHDTGVNDGDRSNPLIPMAREAFESFFGSEVRAGLEKGVALSQAVSLRGQRFILLDNRSFRDVKGLAGGLHWGEAQEDWMMTKLGDSSEPAWLLNGSQFFGGYLGKDAVEDCHPFQFKRVLKRLSSIQAPVLFASGDVHFSEFMKIEKNVLGYETFEVTSSSMHSITIPLHQHRANNPRRVSSTWRHNFVIVETERLSGSAMKIRARSVGEGMDVYFDESGQVSK